MLRIGFGVLLLVPNFLYKSRGEKNTGTYRKLPPALFSYTIAIMNSKSKCTAVEICISLFYIIQKQHKSSHSVLQGHKRNHIDLLSCTLRNWKINFKRQDII